MKEEKNQQVGWVYSMNEKWTKNKSFNFNIKLLSILKMEDIS